MGLQANRYHTLNATAVSHRTRGPPAARPDLVSDLRREVVKIFTGVALSAHMSDSVFNFPYLLLYIATSMSSVF